ncbi:GNAT family N-acetyltransferase [Brachybacterium huguangmaarense]|uniref:GNAT family N-acetyltransferase n=1 Tax=Brachybacterium huguangmaarense TaxID=1652028 RepID=A0ABY6G4Z8_9MICO|nr:GNAT family N-acetyltransferase [Brachybacterium huguangmaarense]UYG17704.1 GNAT family N-acetyltransferase [Brachybacterium huguangmaarense]
MTATANRRVERCRPADAPALWALRRERENWLEHRGIVQWPLDSLPLAEVEEQLAERQWWCVRGNEGIEAAVRVMETDEEFWGADPTPALYLHTLMVALTAGGIGLPAVLLAHAESIARRSGAAALRLDCVERLCPFYERHGFAHVRPRVFPDFTTQLMARVV